MFHYQIFDTKADLAHAFAQKLINLTAQQDKVTLALSGGSTPQAIFDVLAQTYVDKIEWKKLTFFWVDERCVAPTHPDSNYGMTHRHLFSKLPIETHQIFRVKGELKPEEALIDYEALLNKEVKMLNGLPCFDLTILGMGDDGHTASIFPHEIDLWHSPRICTIGHHPQSGQARVSLTGRTINHSREIIFMVTGAGKTDKVYELFTHAPQVKQYPVSLVDVNKSLWWLDKEAARRLP